MGQAIKKQTYTGMEQTLPGYEHIKRFYDKKSNSYISKILPGEYYVSRHNEIIATVLGSCVSVCIRDAKNGVGGMNHFMLPDKKNVPGQHWDFHSSDEATRYGTYAMEHMINDLLKYGGKRNNFEIKLCGGGKIINSMTDIGEKNIIFIKDFLETEGYDVMSEDLGDIYPRKVRYLPRTGKLMIKKLDSVHRNKVAEREVEYKSNLENEGVAGEIELF